MSSLILNNIKNIKELTFLELGVRFNKNFNVILSTEKMSVDTNGHAIFTGTTDDFFKSLTEHDRWDLVYIDADHRYDSVLKDFNNSINHCNEWVLMHDMIPPNEEASKDKFCFDSYKLLYYLLKETVFEVYPMDENFGLTFVKMPVSNINPPSDYKTTTFPTFMEHINTIHLYSWDEIITILNKDNK